MKNVLAVLALMLVASCGLDGGSDDENDVLSNFNGTYNIYEKCEKNDDGSVTYHALPWGGLVGTFQEKNMPLDLSGYESITLDFAEPLPVAVQLYVSNNFKTWGKKGITSLVCNFDGQDVTSVGEIVLQASDTCVITVKNAYLTPAHSFWTSEVVWSGKCSFENWQNGFVVKPEKFVDAAEGDKLEFVYTTDRSDPSVTYWLIKTIYSSTESTLEGNDSQLNEWGCASIGEQSKIYRIPLTMNDIINLREKGLFVNGYYTIVTQVNLLHVDYEGDETMDTSY